MAYINEDDKKEWEESYELLLLKEPVHSELSTGDYITIEKELFDLMVGEINESRVKNKKPGEEVELIVISDE